MDASIPTVVIARLPFRSIAMDVDFDLVEDEECSQNLIMGKAPKWKAQEHAALAQSWIDASEDHGDPVLRVKGTDQRQEAFWKTVVGNFQVAAPVVANGSYHERGVNPIKIQWRDVVARECKAFNRSLLKVFSSNPTGCTEQEEINMAVAIHCKKIDCMSYRHKNFEVPILLNALNKAGPLCLSL